MERHLIEVPANVGLHEHVGRWLCAKDDVLPVDHPGAGYRESVRRHVEADVRQIDFSVVALSPQRAASKCDRHSHAASVVAVGNRREVRF